MSNEYWMSNLSPKVRQMPIIHLAIPGSHNSMTYGIDSNSSLGPDADSATRFWNILPFMVRRWAKTQSSSIQEQLKLGIRFFDLRIARKSDKFYYTHGLFAMEMTEPLLQLRQFLDAHPKEMVVLDLQHFYDCKALHHLQLFSQLIDMFSHRLYATTDGSLHDCTLTRCAQLQRQVVVIYRRCPISLPQQFWPSDAWPTPWPNKDSATQLLSYLKESLLSRHPNRGFVSQCVLTPSGRHIFLRLFSTLEETAEHVEKRLRPWIEGQNPGPCHSKESPRVNVFLADFVQLNDGKFCQLVVNLNSKLDVEKIKIKP